MCRSSSICSLHFNPKDKGCQGLPLPQPEHVGAISEIQFMFENEVFKALTLQRKGQAKRPLNDLAGLNEALQDLMPIVESQAQAKSKASPNAPKFKRSGARSHLQ